MILKQDYRSNVVGYHIEEAGGGVIVSEWSMSGQCFHQTKERPAPSVLCSSCANSPKGSPRTDTTAKLHLSSEIFSLLASSMIRKGVSVRDTARGFHSEALVSAVSLHRRNPSVLKQNSVARKEIGHDHK